MRKEIESQTKLSFSLRDDHVIVVLAVIAGIAVRVFFVSGSPFPVNDGGLFYRMVEDLIGNGFRLPAFTTYNQAEIPFAYPPFGIYIAGLIVKIFKVEVMGVVKWLPCIVSILTLPAFYWSALKIIPNKKVADLSLLVFALLPRSFEWFIMGGGITRSFGLLFIIMAMRFIWIVFSEEHHWTALLWASLLSALAVLSHPEAALYLVFSALLFFVYHGITRQKIICSLLISIGVVVFSAPWWIAILNNNGLEPILTAVGTGHNQWFSLRYILTLNFEFENPLFLTIVGVLAIIGYFTNLDRITKLFAIMLVGGYVIYPRGGVNYLTISVSFLAAYGIDHMINFIDQQYKISKEASQSRNTTYLTSRLSKVFFGFVFIYLIFGAYTVKYTKGYHRVGLSRESEAAIMWLANNAEKGDNVLVYPVNENGRFWWNDYFSEWLPALTDLHSVATVQGYEWLPNTFYERIRAYLDLWSCKMTGPECVRQWEADYEKEFEFLVLTEEVGNANLVQSMTLDREFDLIYDLDEIRIYRNTK